MVGRIEHIAIAVKDVDASAKLFETLLGSERGHTETLPVERVKVAFFELGDSRIELVEGIGSDNPTAKFIEKRGEGIPPICLLPGGESGFLAPERVQWRPGRAGRAAPTEFVADRLSHRSAVSPRVAGHTVH